MNPMRSAKWHGFNTVVFWHATYWCRPGPLNNEPMTLPAYIITPTAFLPEEPLPVFFDKANALRRFMNTKDDDARLTEVEVEYGNGGTVPETFYAAGKLEDSGVKIYGLFTTKGATRKFIADFACEGCLMILPACLGILSTITTASPNLV